MIICIKHAEKIQNVGKCIKPGCLTSVMLHSSVRLLKRIQGRALSCKMYKKGTDEERCRECRHKQRNMLQK